MGFRTTGCQSGAMLSRSDLAVQVRLGLEHLHDFAYLQNLPLVGALGSSGRTADQAVRLLRAELLAAIERLNPGQGVAPRAKERRPYALLYGRYVQGLDTAELTAELAISVRQLRREHKRALGAVVELLWERFGPELQPQRPAAVAPAVSAGPERDGQAAEAEAEAEQLISQGRAEDLDLSALVAGIVAMLAPVAAGRHTHLAHRLPADLPPVHADRVVLRQGLLELVSRAMDRAQGGSVLIDGEAGADMVLRITARNGAETDGRPPGVGLAISQRLIVSLGGRIEIHEEPGWCCATVTLLPAEHAPILVMDDNQGLVELFRRYLAGRPYRVVQAQTVEQAIRHAREARLRLILLDVMMPQQDGWEVLQLLRQAPETRDIPVAVCSVLHEPELARALGASDYIAKPVTQDVLLAKVEQWCAHQM